VVIFGLFSSFIKETLRLGEAPVATVVGIVIGPHALNLFNPYDWGGKDNEKVTNEITLEVTRVVIALSVFAVGVELPKVPLLSKFENGMLTHRHTYGDIGVHSSFYLDHVWCGDGWSLLF
jgi:NhaP-type Na+/H+ or K+/H+ antiporter